MLRIKDINKWQGLIRMTKTMLIIIRIICWAYGIFLGICYHFFREELSFITTNFSGFIFFVICLILTNYNFGYSEKN